jgi:hypothetical protein
LALHTEGHAMLVEDLFWRNLKKNEEQKHRQAKLQYNHIAKPFNDGNFLIHYFQSKGKRPIAQICTCTQA